MKTVTWPCKPIHKNINTHKSNHGHPWSVLLWSSHFSNSFRDQQHFHPTFENTLSFSHTVTVHVKQTFNILIMHDDTIWCRRSAPFRLLSRSMPISRTCRRISMALAPWLPLTVQTDDQSTDFLSRNKPCDSREKRDNKSVVDGTWNGSSI